LTHQECEIAQLIGQGCYHDQIAQVLGVSNGTVKNPISTIYNKSEASSRQQAILVIKKLR